MRKQAFKYFVLIAAVLSLVAVVGATPSTSDDDLAFVQAENSASGVGIVVEPKGATGDSVYIIRLNHAPLASYDGSIAGLEATSASVLGDAKLDMTSEASLAYSQFLAAEQAKVVSAMGESLERTIKPVYNYSVAFNGLAVVLSPAEAAEVAKIPAVATVQRDFMRQPMTSTTPAFIGADTIWDGSNVLGGVGSKGEGVIFGVIDTGVWPEHPSFADDGSYPAPPAEWGGTCSAPEDGTAPYTCTNKLIGVQHFLAGYVAAVGGYDGLFLSGRDDDGHGTHTGSTAAGNEGVAASVLGVDRGTVSGIAPRAYVSSYKVCGPQGCVGSDLVAGIDQAVADGVHTINYSIGGGSSDPWVDGDALSFLAARDAGIFVATSAGNSGPGATTVGSPGDAPWITTVGASTSNRHYISDITLTGPGEVPTGLYGASLTDGVTDFRLVDAEGIADSTGDASGLCLNPFDPGTFEATDVVLCQRGQIARVLRGDYVQAGGGGGVILYNPVTQGLSTDLYVIPAVHVEDNIGLAIKDYVVANPGAEIRVSFTPGTEVMDDDPRVISDMMAAFSSRGPNAQVDVIKPDVTAPGVQILAGTTPEHAGAGAQGELFMAIQGTSMSSPHVAGAGTLLTAVHPDWSPAQIQSALMMTGNTNHLKEDGMTPADPFDMGAGRIDLTMAAKAGLVMDESTDDYVNADPFFGGDPAQLNIPSLQNSKCVQTCSWMRTVTSPLDASVTYTATVMMPDGASGTVTPATFTVDGGASQDLEITVDASGLESDVWAFGWVYLMPSDESVPSAHMPIAIIPTTGNLPASLNIYAGRDAGSWLLQDLEAIEITELTAEAHGFTKGNVVDLMLPPDSTNGDPFDNLDEVFFAIGSVQEGTSRLVAEIPASTAPDMDLYWGLDANGDGLPSADEVLGASTTGSFIEYLNADNPTPGNYWILVQNWAGSGAELDHVQLVVGSVLSNDEGNMTISGPSSNPAATPFDLRIGWNLDTEPGDFWYGAASIGSAPDSPGDVGRINVDLHRGHDDVWKQADKSSAVAGETVTFEVSVAPNTLPESVSYSITDMIPDGLTYVEGSASATSGDVMVDGNTITWDVTQSLELRYTVSTSLGDPSCTMPLANSGTYVDLEQFGFGTTAGIEGNNVAFQDTSYGGGAYAFYNEPGADGTVYFSDDGVASLDLPSILADSSVNAAIPSADLPNALLAMLWNDMEIVYDEAANRGVTTGIQLTSGGVPSAKLLEFDDIQMVGDPSSTADFEMLIREFVNDDPGAFEIIFAYDNLAGNFTNMTVGTIGVEDWTGERGTQYAYNDAALQTLENGMSICFDLIEGSDLATLTYQATVDAGAVGAVVNTAVSTSSNVGSAEASASTMVRLGHTYFMPIVPKN
ncbi:MAG: S8 family serine peptidase [Chloroflexota bacterium]